MACKQCCQLRCQIQVLFSHSLKYVDYVVKRLSANKNLNNKRYCNFLSQQGKKDRPTRCEFDHFTCLFGNPRRVTGDINSIMVKTDVGSSC